MKVPNFLISWTFTILLCIFCFCNFSFCLNVIVWVTLLILVTCCAYLNHVSRQLHNYYHFLYALRFHLCWASCYSMTAKKEDIVPPVPILTRYSREHGIKAFVKKELRDSKLPDSRRSSDVNILATSTLCIQLNTLHVSSTIIWPAF